MPVVFFFVIVFFRCLFVAAWFVQFICLCCFVCKVIIVWFRCAAPVCFLCAAFYIVLLLECPVELLPAKQADQVDCRDRVLARIHI